MGEDKQGMRKQLFRPLRAETLMLGLVALTLLAAVPARADDDDEDAGWTDRIGDQIQGAMKSAGKAVGLTGKPPGPPPVESISGCPTIGILEGTAGSRIMTAGGTGNQGVRYQFSISNVGRQCTIGGGRIAIKVAASGRVLLGPAGAPGTFNVPIRVVVFSEAQQKPVTSKLYNVPTSVGAGSAPFQFVSEDIVVPTSGDAVREYTIKVGLDTAKGGGDAGAKKSRHKTKPVASASR